jgi:hypothetical protein
MPPRPRLVPASPQPDAAERRLQIHGIEEMPAGYDAEVAELFRDLRAASALSETDLAARLGTRADVVQALEQGALYALPPWAETCRVVNAYGALLNLDVRPLLRRIYAQLEAGIVELRPKAMPDVPVMTPPDNSDFAFRPDKQAAPAARSPLDIEWTPDPVPARPQNPTPQPPPRPQAPQAPSQNASQPPQAWPGGPPPRAPQAPWPGAAPQRSAAPPPQQAERRPQQRPPQAPQGAAPQGQAPQGPAPQRQPQSQPQQPQTRQPAPPQPPKPRAEFAPPPPPPPPPVAPAAAKAIPEPAAVEEKSRRKSPLLKWGVIALLLAIMAAGAWLVLNGMTSPLGVKSPSAGSQTLDPDDPRSRKADKLQGPS